MLRTSRLLRLSLWLLPAAVALAVAPRLLAFQSTKTVYVTFLDDKGAPITDLQQSDIHIAEDGKEWPVVSAKLATAPLSVMLLADTTKTAGGAGLDRRGSSANSAGDLTRDIRASLSAFVTAMNAASPDTEMGIMEFGQASVLDVPFTNNTETLEKGITKLFPQPNAQSVLLEAIMESAKELSKRKNGRRAIVSVNVEPGDEASREPPNNILKELAKSRAPLYAVSLQKGDLRNATRGAAMPVLTKNTGGRLDFIVGQSAMVDLMKTYVADLMAQYEITYTRGSGPTPNRLMIGVARTGVTYLASAFPPQ